MSATFEHIEIKQLNEKSCPWKKHGENEIDVLSYEVYGFNPGQNLDIKTNLALAIPDDKMCIIMPTKPLLLLHTPIFEGGKLTFRVHNSSVGKYGTHIVSPGETICRLRVVSK